VFRERAYALTRENVPSTNDLPLGDLRPRLVLEAAIVLGDVLERG
jgi:hypothetical protein